MRCDGPVSHEAGHKTCFPIFPTETMTAKSLISVLTVIGGATVLSVLAAADKAAPAPSPLVKRGEYLVNKVGLCIDCHSPRNERGEFIAGAHLAGAPIGFAPTAPMPWAPVAPPLAGLPTMNDGQALRGREAVNVGRRA